MPDPIKLGDTSSKIVDVQYENHPQYGPSITFVWEGEEEAMRTLAANGGGIGRAYRFNGPVWRTTLRYGDAQDGSPEVPIDTWEIDSDYAEGPIWESPKLINLAGGDDAIAQWKADILDAADAKKTPSQSLFVGDKLALYIEYLRGTRAYEIKRPTAKRTRAISAKYATPVRIVVPEPIYTTQALVRDFGIPARNAAQLPDDPPVSLTPSGRIWAWKQRKESSKTMIALNKTEESIEFVFTPWTYLTHTLIS